MLLMFSNLVFKLTAMADGSRGKRIRRRWQAAGEGRKRKAEAKSNNKKDNETVDLVQPSTPQNISRTGIEPVTDGYQIDTTVHRSAN